MTLIDDGLDSSQLVQFGDGSDGSHVLVADSTTADLGIDPNSPAAYFDNLDLDGYILTLLLADPFRLCVRGTLTGNDGTIVGDGLQGGGASGGSGEVGEGSLGSDTNFTGEVLGGSGGGSTQITIAARHIVGDITFASIGGDGNPGGGSVTLDCGGGGGGGGGSGGVITVIYSTCDTTPTWILDGGDGGPGGSGGGGAGADGAVGDAGGTGQWRMINLTTGTLTVGP